jgi:hypothetical protein
MEIISMKELGWALEDMSGLQAHHNRGRDCIIHQDSRTLAKTDVISRAPVQNQKQPFAILDSMYWGNPPHLQSIPR